MVNRLNEASLDNTTILSNDIHLPPRLYLVDAFKGRNPTTVSLLTDAADRLGIECDVLYADVCDFTKIPSVRKNDLLYGISSEPDAKALFKYIAAIRKPKTIFTDLESLVRAGDNVLQATLLHEVAGLPVNKTVYTLTTDRERLDSYVDYLGGYPVIVKSAGGSHGVGVMRFDSPPSLYAGADFLKKMGGSYVMRQFVPHDSHARLIVLDGRVIDSIAYERVANDFRTNSSKTPGVTKKKYSNEVESVAIKATAAIGAEFGGVDILIDSKGGLHVIEVNTPCFFARAQDMSGVDIAGMIIAHLLRKSRKYVA